MRDAADMAAQKQYIANNPVRKNYRDCAHVHTRYAKLIDATPGAEAPMLQ